jgi:hypothetical protein
MDLDTAKSDVESVYGAALEFVSNLGHLSTAARSSKSRGYGSAGDMQGKKGPPANRPHDWVHLGHPFAFAFIAWFDLTHLLTPHVRRFVRHAYGATDGPVRVGNCKPGMSVIEIVDDPIGVQFRNGVYGGRSHPLEPDVAAKVQQAIRRSQSVGSRGGWKEHFERLMKSETRRTVRGRLGITTWADGVEFMRKEWLSLSTTQVEHALSMWRFESIEFDDLIPRLKREADCVLALIEHRQDIGGQKGSVKKKRRRRQSRNRKPQARRPLHQPDGWTKKALVNQIAAFLGKFSGSSFDNIRKRTDVPAAPKGGKGPHHHFSVRDVKKFIKAVETGPFRRRNEIAAALRDLLPR